MRICRISIVLVITLLLVLSDSLSCVTNTAKVKITASFNDGLVPRVESDEYVEVKNLGQEPVDIEGWGC
jgi:uncharacterized protein involved in cysteine biosynthesis